MPKNSVEVQQAGLRDEIKRLGQDPSVMPLFIPGIHHVTTIAGPPQPTVDFYAGVLGLRLVKRTVNFDDPGTYHLYFGDDAGRPGTILTCFPWPHAVPGHAGAGMAGATAFSVPVAALDFWQARLAAAGVEAEAPAVRFGTPVLGFRDADGLPVELVAEAADASGGWSGGTVPAAQALRGFHSVTLLLRDLAPTARLLTEVFGYQAAGEEDGRLRFRGPGGARGAVVDLRRADGPGRAGAGTVHHVAFRARDDEEQHAWRERLLGAGLRVTEVLDRNYFRSIYFREPGGVLFEIATDTPGFTADESEEALGTRLMLPAWLEPRREELEARLPALQT